MGGGVRFVGVVSGAMSRRDWSARGEVAIREHIGEVAGRVRAGGICPATGPAETRRAGRAGRFHIGACLGCIARVPPGPLALGMLGSAPYKAIPANHASYPHLGAGPRAGLGHCRPDRHPAGRQPPGRRGGRGRSGAVFRWRVESLDGAPVRSAAGQMIAVDGRIDGGSAADAVCGGRAVRVRRRQAAGSPRARRRCWRPAPPA